MPLSADTRAWLTLVFLSLIWGTSFILIKKALVVFNPLEVALLRVSLSGLAFTPFFVAAFKKLEWHRWFLYLIIALTGSGIPAILFATAQTQLSSGTAGVLNSLTPIFALIVGILIFKNTTSKYQVIGILMGFVGAAFLILMDQPIGAAAEGSHIWYGLLIVLGSILYGTNVNIVKAKMQHVNSMHLSSFAFFMLGAPLLLLIPLTEIPDKVMTHPLGWQSLGYMAILALVSTVLALIIFYRLVQQTSAVFGASVAYIIPIVALVWGWIDGESLGWTHFAGMGLIITGVYLSRRTPKLVTAH
ncbi:MAG: DMT family transporter [Bacteroidota bacterium]